MDPRLKKLLIHTIYIEPYAGVDANGEELYGDPVAYKARIEQRTRYVRGPGGDLVESRSMLFMDLTDIDARSRITLPDGAKRPIFRVDTIPGRRANDHTVVMI